MAISPAIGLDNMEENQNNPHTTFNSSVNKMDGSVNDEHTETFADANITMDIDDFLDNGKIILTGSVTAQRQLLIPEDFSLGGDTITPRKFFWVKCEVTGGFAIEVITDDSAAVGVEVRLGDYLLLEKDGVDIKTVGYLPRAPEDDHTFPNVPVLFEVEVPAATGNIDITLPSDVPIRVIDAHCVKRGGAGTAGDTVQVQESTNAITDAMDLNTADNSIVRASTIDDSQWDIPGGGVLRIAATQGGSDVQCKCFVWARIGN